MSGVRDLEGAGAAQLCSRTLYTRRRTLCCRFALYIYDNIYIYIYIYIYINDNIKRACTPENTPPSFWEERKQYKPPLPHQHQSVLSFVCFKKKRVGAARPRASIVWKGKQLVQEGTSRGFLCCIYIFIYMYVYIYIHIHTHTHTHTHTHKHKHTYKHKHTHTHTHIHSYVCYMHT